MENPIKSIAIRTALASALCAFAIFGAKPASANLMYTYTTSGTTSGGSVAGTAAFDIGASTMTVTITNTTATVGYIGQVLDGLAFALTGGSGLSLTSVVASGFVDCTSNTCTNVSTFRAYTGNGSTWTTLNSPYDWAYSGSLLSAGNGSYKPAGIVNNSVTAPNNGGIANAPHNDYLLGPVVFTFGFTTAPTDVTAATFYWGTTPETTTGSSSSSSGGGGASSGGNIPEPGTLALLGLGLVMAAGIGLRRPALRRTQAG